MDTGSIMGSITGPISTVGVPKASGEPAPGQWRPGRSTDIDALIAQIRYQFSFDAVLSSARASGNPQVRETGEAAGASGTGEPGTKARPAEKMDKDALRAAIQEFEAFMVQKLWEGLKKTVPEGGLFEKSFASDSYEGMLIEEYSKLMARAGGIGIGDIVYSQLASQDTGAGASKSI